MKQSKIIESTIDRLRDPCILVAGDTYYAYGSQWTCYRNSSGSLAGKWEKIEKEIAVDPPTCTGCKWAPEVHAYKGSYYMFTTYSSSITGHRGSTILKSESPEGPFVEITNGHLTPSDWDCIDATFYVDPDGQPWMVFVHEWTSTEDKVGRMAIAKLSDDLTHFISEPVEIFRADDPAWTDSNVTDGCWMYTTSEGKLLMIWSNFCSEGYCVGIAHPDNNKIDGNWIQEDTLLYSKSSTGVYDGGHGMIFTGLDGITYLSIHSPNAAVGDRQEKPVFIPLKEENGTLICDLWTE